MERKEMDLVLEDFHYLKGGTREACVKAREYISHIINPGNQLHAPLSCVSANEFVEAVKVLMAFAFVQNDTVPDTWKCDNDCHRSSYFLCPGECNINKNSDKMCPFFMDEGLV
ncbi:MAG: hypothetical protein IKR04_02880 [Clostridia bacterium]|nr:hypothetical protein [Clostridia bacterium]